MTQLKNSLRIEIEPDFDFSPIVGHEDLNRAYLDMIEEYLTLISKNDELLKNIFIWEILNWIKYDTDIEVENLGDFEAQYNNLKELDVLIVEASDTCEKKLRDFIYDIFEIKQILESNPLGSDSSEVERGNSHKEWLECEWKIPYRELIYNRLLSKKLVISEREYKAINSKSYKEHILRVK